LQKIKEGKMIHNNINELTNIERNTPLKHKATWIPTSAAK